MTSMRDAWERAQQSAGSSWLLWVLFVGCIWVGGLLVLSGSARTGLFAPPLIIVGLVAVMHAVHRFRRPDWRNSEWWREHPLLAHALSGTSGSLPGITARGSDLFSAALQFFAGAVFIFAGVASAIAAIAG